MKEKHIRVRNEEKMKTSRTRETFYLGFASEKEDTLKKPGSVAYGNELATVSFLLKPGVNSGLALMFWYFLSVCVLSDDSRYYFLYYHRVMVCKVAVQR